MLTLLVKMMLLCFVILTSLTAVVNVPTELDSGTFPVELEWGYGLKTVNFTEIGDHKLYDSIIDKAAHLPKEGYSDVKYQIPAT